MLRWLRSSRSGVRALGPLESELLHRLWQRGDATVRELCDEAQVGAAYTTVMTTLDRLYKKGLLERLPEGRAFRYRPRQTEEELHRTIVAADLQQLLASTSNNAAPLSFLVDTISQHDAALLVELRRAIERKQRELQKKEKR